MKKNVSIIIFGLLIIFNFLPLNSTFAQTLDTYAIPVENLSDLLNHIRAMEIKISTHEGDSGTFSYEVVGEETIDGSPTWKVNVEYGEEDAETISTLWVEKSTGVAVKAKIDDTIITGTYAELYGNATFTFWIAIHSAWLAWDFSVLYSIPTEYGYLTFIGTEQHAFGPTTLLIYKYRFTGYATAPEHYRYNMESWLAPTQFGGIMAYLYYESLDQQEWFMWELVSIELAEPQEIPVVSIGAPIVSTLNVEPNEEFTLSVDVSNDGGSSAIHYVTLLVDGDLTDNQIIPLEPGETETVSFTLSFDAEGEYEVEIGGKTVNVVVGVQHPAYFTFGDLNISPSSVGVGGTVTVSVEVTNTGGESGSHTVTLKIDGEVEDEKTITLNPDATRTVSFEVSAVQQGTFSVDLNGLSGSFIVTKPIEEEKPGGGGIPGFPYDSIILGLVAGFLILWTLRRRQ